MGRVVIACFRPRPGKDADLLAAVKDHMPTLRSEGLITNREVVVMRAGDGTIIEVFEWRSQESIDRAHENPSVQKLWARFEAACEYVPIGSVAEASHMFSGFEPVQV